MRDRTNIVHENVGRDGLKVKEDSVGEEDEKHGGIHSEDGARIQQEEGHGDHHHCGGKARVELHLRRGVLEALAADEHLAVHVLTALRDVGQKGGLDHVKKIKSGKII